ncbi:hypothetical protein I350_07285 [Cryptococcus amylolentus CBS 6273]|uniref:C2H2-type domain-containing protein n=1 Tax=Cryptococcus amylolentus CBS 6273 TaxID=1296118 RepID=A0A1E3JE22_9TREE|nr:hypothetical protein I350_07285 [Cryptococcus amylolentus CBS 6273]
MSPSSSPAPPAALHPHLRDQLTESHASSPATSGDVDEDVRMEGEDELEVEDKAAEELPPKAEPVAEVKAEDEKKEEKEKCLWGDCEDEFADKQVFYGHVKDHINASKEFACEWRTCARVGSKQGRSLLLTHIRGHTGEKPYTCNIADCGKSFARTDALNKHKRTVHADLLNPNGAPPKPAKETKEPKEPKAKGPGRGKGRKSLAAAGSASSSNALPDATSANYRPRTPPTLVPTQSIPPGFVAPDSDLCYDSELYDVIPRLRARRRCLPESEEELYALIAAEKKFPKHRMFPDYSPEEDGGRDRAEGSGQEVNGKRRKTVLDDLIPNPLDEPVIPPRPDANPHASAELDDIFPLTSTLVQQIDDAEDPESGSIQVLSRCRWQARYVLAKARLMLLDEENGMRQGYLRDIMEIQMRAGVAGQVIEEKPAN